MGHWTYRRQEEDEGWTCRGCASREEAIEEALGELDDSDHVVVMPCEEEMPSPPSLDVEKLIEDYTESNEGELWEDYGVAMYSKDSRWSNLRSEVLQDFETVLTPLWDALQGALTELLKKHAGVVHQSGQEEVIERCEACEWCLPYDREKTRQLQCPECGLDQDVCPKATFHGNPCSRG